MRALGWGRLAAVLLGLVLVVLAAALAVLTRTPGRDNDPGERRRRPRPDRHRYRLASAWRNRLLAGRLGRHRPAWPPGGDSRRANRHPRADRSIDAATRLDHHQPRPGGAARGRRRLRGGCTGGFPGGGYLLMHAHGTATRWGPGWDLGEPRRDRREAMAPHTPPVLDECVHGETEEADDAGGA